jgi:dipeptidyl aminopeptidase/acylaminoacyl peptidase
VNEQEPQLIPRQILFGNPDKAAVKLSPDGAQISYLAPVEGVLNVWVGPVDDPTSARPVTADRDRGIRFYEWAFNNSHILYIQDKGGDENWRLYSVALQSGETQDLTPMEGVQARFQQMSPGQPDQILISLNDQNPQLHNLYRIDLNSGERELVAENPGFSGYVTDDEYNVRFAVQMTADGGVVIAKPGEADAWSPFLKIEMEDTLTTSPVTFDSSGKTLYAIDSRGRDTAALVSLDPESGETTLLAADPRADVTDLMIHPARKTVQAVAFMYERKEWQVLDPEVEGDLNYLRTVSRGDLEVISRTLADDAWIVAYMVDDGPVRYYHYNRKKQEARFLFTNRASLEGLLLARMYPVVIESRDGLKLVSYCTLPVGSNPNGGLQTSSPLPMVLLVHGGPWGRDAWGYNSIHQWLANRGYAVLSVNFRASTGFGKSFINAGNLEWGARMHDDLIDAVNWAIAQGIADPDQVAIMGGSYGGYATLAGLTFTPETFACGVDIVGPSNLMTLIESIPPYWQPQIELFAKRMGDHRTEEGQAFLRERSPLTYVERIQRPLLIGQGANDPRVKQAESDQIVEAMQEKNIPVTYVLYPDEGHGFARPENNLSFFAVAEAFLASVVEGRYEPIGEDFQNSSIQVPTGADHVPGLADALKSG